MPNHGFSKVRNFSLWLRVENQNMLFSLNFLQERHRLQILSSDLGKTMHAKQLLRKSKLHLDRSGRYPARRIQGDWSAPAITQDFGIISITGVPVSGGYGGENVGGWADISKLLYANQDNIVTVSVWNIEGTYSWDFSIRHGESIIWGSENAGTGQFGEVFFREIIIDGQGNIIL